MAVIKCKMCGGDLNITEGLSVVECEYCGSRQTIPNADNEKKMTLFARAGRLLRGCEFDKASGVFESIVADFPEEAEAYWGLVLCKYGIEYVDDPATGKKVPTCHRSSFDSVLDDPNFEQACENGDVIARRVYREEARQIEELRKGIIEVSGKEAPYDIFISYKETDDQGNRTLDSVIAQDLYNELTEKGYRVFFSRISLEDKLGVEYEPYIFAALNSARLMLVVGTDYEHFDAVWVKNEWSRFLKLISSGQKKVLIPVFKNMDPYDMPKEFAKLSAQDMGKVGAMQDLLRGVEKILGGKTEEKKETVVIQQSSGGPNVQALLKRGEMALADKDWAGAKEFFNRVLDMDAECGMAYFGLALVTVKGSLDKLAELCLKQEIKEIQRARRFADSETRKQLAKLDDALPRAMEREEQKKQQELRLARQRQEQERLALEERQKKAELVRAAQAKKQETIYKNRCKKLVASTKHIVGLCSDGTVMFAGESKIPACDTGTWKNITAVDAGSWHTVGLRADGTVISTKVKSKFFDLGQDQVSDWTDIVAITADGLRTVGLRADGTVVDTSRQHKDVEKWKNIVAVAASDYITIGLKADGTVDYSISPSRSCLKDHGEDIRTKWENIVAVSCASFHVIALKSDGTVVAGKTDGTNQDADYLAVENWRDIVAISAGDYHTVGLKADGTVVSTQIKDKKLDRGQTCVSWWKNIVAISADNIYTVGLKADGSVVFAGNNADWLRSVSEWKLFNSTIVQEQTEVDEEELRRQQAKEKAQLEAIKKQKEIRRSGLNAQKLAIEKELPTLNGLFSGKRRKELEAKLAEIEKELKTLQ